MLFFFRPNWTEPIKLFNNGVAIYYIINILLNLPGLKKQCGYHGYIF